MLKILLYLASAVPVFLFVKTVFFKRSHALKAASSNFDKQVGYLALAILTILGASVVYFLIHTWMAKP